MATTDGAELRRRLLEEEQRTHGNHDYRRFHEGRFRYVLSLCRELVPSPDAPVLDVGRSFLTSVLATHYRDVTTLGFAPADDGHVAAHSIGALRGPHIAFDLNDARSPELWPKLGARFGLVVFAEVIEHLYAAPEFALGLLREALAPGGFLVCQTPNATSLTKRLKMILGQNPF